MSVVLLAAIHYLIVLDEERVLETTFKKEYEDYKKLTRRWF
jgi:protein-S-isoprenylcysteine O-methyltransferase Ste14